jgi:hypothetical protein
MKNYNSLIKGFDCRAMQIQSGIWSNFLKTNQVVKIRIKRKAKKMTTTERLNRSAEPVKIKANPVKTNAE